MRSKKIVAVSALAALAASVAGVGPIASGSAEGRNLVGAFCTNPNAMPKPGACISLSYDGQTAEGYTGSGSRSLALRPGTYWLTVDDNSSAHNYSLAMPDGTEHQITGVVDAPGPVTIEVHLEHGSYTLFCEPHRAMGMYVDIEVGGVGQVG